MLFFLDTANFDEIREAADFGFLDGVTTNPTLVSKEGKDFKETVLKICGVVKGPVNAEVVSTDAPGMVAEAREIIKWAPNIFVKIPMTEEGMKATSRLSQEGVRVNVTLIFSPNQSLLAAKAGATYVSPFVGRLDDVGEDGMKVVEESVNIFKIYNYNTQVLAASLRHPMHVFRAAQAGAHVATMPFSVLKQMFKHPLTDIGLKRFLDDWKKVPQKDLVKR